MSTIDFDRSQLYQYDDPDQIPITSKTNKNTPLTLME
jgi:hypothetical protein